VPHGAVTCLRLDHTLPYAWPELLAFLGARAIPGVEAVEGGRYLRTIALDGTAGWVAVEPGKDGAYLTAEVHLAQRVVWPVPGTPAIPAQVGIEARIEIIQARLRRIFDLDADVAEIERRLSCDPHLRPLVEARPGLRVPGTWDPFELAVRAILGQQVSVPAARTLAGRFATTQGWLLDPPPPPGVPGTVFPSAADVRPDELVRLGVTRPRAAALASLARKVAAEPDVLASGADLDSTVARLTALPGVGPWTAHYIAMRALREPDAFPRGDLGLLRALEEGGHRPSPAELLRRAEAWRPYRAYAALHLWSAGTPPRLSENRR